jgi:hypothetical protein
MLDKYVQYPHPTPISELSNIFELYSQRLEYSIRLLIIRCLSSGCWTNALQPLWIAGKAMSHYSEHAAIVETLVRIERETGWATAWRVEDLKEFWGEYDNDNCDVDVD